MRSAMMARMRKAILALLGGGLFAAIWAMYRKPCDETPCEDIPEDSVAFAPAFLDLGEENGVIIPGRANIQIAKKLEECAARFSLVLTQKAVSDALANPSSLGDGTPVEQMHRHDPNIEVRTFAALKCALTRFGSIPERLVLIAHPKHHKRVLMDLRALYAGEITELCLGDVYYEDDHWSRPFRWAWKNTLGWLGDYLLILSIRYPTGARLLKVFLVKFAITADCPAGVQLSKIVEKDGKWTTPTC
jgi:hypothetical protein